MRLRATLLSTLRCACARMAAGQVAPTNQLASPASMMFQINPLRRCAALLVLGMFSAAAWPQGQPQNLAAVTLQVGMHSIRAQLASTPQQRQIGLMFRQSMPNHEGMLFAFEEPATQCFWMRNTLIPLSIAFLADDGTVVSLADMKPQSDESHCSAKPVRYALEMNQGWFAKRGVKPGMRIGGELFGK